MKRIVSKFIVIIMIFLCFCFNGYTVSATVNNSVMSELVDGDLSLSEGAKPYVASNKDVAMDQKKLKELKSRQNNIVSRTVYRVLNVPCYIQENNHYCGPTTVKSILNYRNGTSLSQSQYASQLGTTDSGTTMTNIPGVLNSHQNYMSYIYYEFDNYLDWYVRVGLDIQNDIPLVIDIASEESNWMYSTSGHYMSISGYDDSSSTKYAYITDSHPTYYGLYMLPAEQVYTVNRNHWRSAIIW